MSDRLRRCFSATVLCAVTLLLALSALFRGEDAPVFTALLRARDSIALALGNRTVGEIYISEDRLLRLQSPPEGSTEDSTEDSPLVKQTAEALGAFAAEAGAPVCLLAVPTSAGIYSDALPAGLPVMNEHEMLSDLHRSLTGGIVWVEAESWLYPVREQDICCRNDSGLTEYGTYCVYRTAIRKLGFNAAGSDSFVIRHFGSYRGELARESRYEAFPPDPVDCYYPVEGQQVFTVTALRAEGRVPLGDSCYLTERAERTGRAEDVYLTAGEPAVRAVAEDRSGRRLLLLTDDSGGKLIPFLLLHYGEVTAVNLPLAQETDWRALTGSGYDQILIYLGADHLFPVPGLEGKSDAD